ncbi:MAG TPA: indolepyruvate ferredoxin oxidoreductase family protein, partial [Acetobacteraceae bacterium]|nr:indolepyruvate ferredoxin oxidoreductase family protein [Acetobacteraceae bacterium]
MDIGLGHVPITLESRFDDLDTPVLLSGIQALVRVLLEQSRLDRAAGLNTGGFVSGYRGSPLGGLDQELWRRQKLLAERNIHFQPGVNEDLAATMLYGTQHLDAFPGKRVDGVFGMWYGKGPGVDRAGDALHCGNFLGTSKHGGVLAVSGDDHGAHSSTYPHQTEHVFEGVFIPVLNPASAADMLDLGLAGIALSRYCGLWVAMKTTAETAEQAATLVIPSTRAFVTPDFTLPPHGLSFDPTMRFPADRAELERRVVQERIPAALAWARANRLDRKLFGSDDAPIGIVTVGRAHEDTMRALRTLDLEHHAQIALYKVAMTWPLETSGIREFARGKRALLVIEEKRSFVESQIRDALYNLPADQRPEISGKTTPSGEPLLSPLLELSPEDIATGMASYLRTAGLNIPDPPAHRMPDRPVGLLRRIPAFCAGCPHGTSTRLPDGSFATAGIGCHFMALDDGDQTRTFTHMGGEGAPFVGMAPFTDTKHMFANMGDGTYTHSGIMAIRQAVAAKARITYKLLVNDAVAMTGGQPAEGSYTVPQYAAQLAAEGIARIAVVADEADRLPPPSALPPGTTRHVRADLDTVQRELREYDGVSALIYDQVCATEKRRRRKRGKMPQPTQSVVINEAVCENCGDCSKQSSCIAIEPVETAFGRKRRINPTSCNVDLSCLKGFCPSFVTVAGAPSAPDADPHWQAREGELAAALPQPRIPSMERPWRALFAGIGGGGIVTSGAILAMAAHLEGKGVRTLDFTGMAQKNGTVVAHVQIADDEASLDVVRVPLGTADVMIAADLAVAAGAGVLERNAPAAAVIGNLDLAATAAFKHDANLSIDAVLHRRTIERVTDAAASSWLHAVRLAEHLFGNAQAMNTMLLGLAWQRGLVPVGEAAILRAIELNGAAVSLNHRAFLWGRILAERPTLEDEILVHVQDKPPATLDALIESRAISLIAYQSRRLANRYRAMMKDVTTAETQAMGSADRVSRAAAEGLYRVMAYKDEYEVA